MKKKWHRYHYKNLTYFGLSVLIGLILLKTTFFREIVFHLGNLGYIGAFFGGILFVSTFTVSIGTALLLLLAETLHPIAIGLIAGFGAVLSDLTIFHYIRNKGLGDEIKYFFEFFGSDKLRHLIHSKYFSWTLPVLGAIIIASPLPDEMGIGLMGISKLKTSQFILLSFVLNSIGIFIIVSAGAFFKPGLVSIKFERKKFQQRPTFSAQNYNTSNMEGAVKLFEAFQALSFEAKRALTYLVEWPLIVGLSQLLNPLN
ncbi:hypothetical protein GW846_06480 [Candidatus Gracilibacteria bacterium]|nr:hypothetical protein [Candidatus Gracilibacteria bacterium]